MVAELTPGTPEAGRAAADERIPIGQTLPDVNLDEILAALDGDTRAYLVMLLSGGAEGLRGNSTELANAIRRFEPLARDSRKISEQLATRRKNIQRVIHNFSLLSEALGDKDQAARRVRGELQRRLRGAGRPGRGAARLAAGAADRARRDDGAR